MKSSENTTSGTSWLLLFLGMLLFVFSNGHWTVPLAAWGAPVLLLRFVRDKKPFPALAILLVLMTVSSGLMLFGIIPALLGFLTYVLIFYYAFLWWFPYLMDKWIASRLKGFVSTLVFPMAMVTAEFINTIFFGSWAATAYSQFDHLALIQISSITGMWGVTFIIMWLASVVNWAMDNNFDWQKIKKGVFIYSGILFLILFYGGFRLAVFPPQSETVNIVSFTPQEELDSYLGELDKRGYNSSVHMAGTSRDSLSNLLGQTHKDIFKRNEEIIGPDAKICLWPEGAISVLEEDEAVFLERGKALVRKKNIYLLLGYLLIPDKDPGRLRENKAILLNPAGEIEYEFLKANATPGSTDREGDGIIPVADSPFGRLSTTICYDMDFTSLLYKAGKANVDIMLVPAWDWKDIDPLHARMAVFRVIENGFSMVRQTGEGLSIAVDYQGRTLASMDHFTTNDYTMVSQVPVNGSKTLYSVMGDLFAWLCVVGLLVLGFLRISRIIL